MRTIARPRISAALRVSVVIASLILAAGCGGGGGDGGSGGSAGQGTGGTGQAGHGGSAGSAAAGGRNAGGAAGGACAALQSCCATLGAQAQACLDDFANAHGDETTCASEQQLLCAQHTCADLNACCEKLTDAARSNCQNQAMQAGNSNAICSLLYVSLKCGS